MKSLSSVDMVCPAGFCFTVASRRRLGVAVTGSRSLAAERAMKVRASVKKICDKCKVIRRRGIVRVFCALIPVTSSARGSSDIENSEA